MDAGGTSYMNDIDTDFPRDITILKSFTEVQKKDGKRIELKDGLYNHHTTFLTSLKRIHRPLSVPHKSQGSIRELSLFSLLASWKMLRKSSWLRLVL
jgi:hypothetical protein